MNEKLQPKNNEKLNNEELLKRFETLPLKVVNALVTSTSNLCVEKEDLIQEAYIELITCYSKYDETKGDFEPFATSCIYNRTKSLLKKYSYSNMAPVENIVEIVDANEAYAIDSMIQELEEKELTKKVARFMAEHKLVKFKGCDPVKVIFMLAEEMNTREIADAFGVSTQTVCSFIRRFREKVGSSQEYADFKARELC